MPLSGSGKPGATGKRRSWLPGAWLPRRLIVPVVRFRRDENGATAVEFALVSVPFIGLLFAIFETALVFFANQGLEAATAEAARQLMTGQVQYDPTITSYTTFRNKVFCNPPSPRVRILPSFIDCNKLVIDISKPTNFGTANLNMDFLTGTSTFCTGLPGEIMVLRVVYPMPVYLSVLTMNGLAVGQTIVNRNGQQMYDGSWKHMLMGTSAFRNEPFPAGTRTVNC